MTSRITLCIHAKKCLHSNNECDSSVERQSLDAKSRDRVSSPDMEPWCQYLCLWTWIFYSSLSLEPESRMKPNRRMRTLEHSQGNQSNASTNKRSHWSLAGNRAAPKHWLLCPHSHLQLSEKNLPDCHYKIKRKRLVINSSCWISPCWNYSVRLQNKMSFFCEERTSFPCDFDAIHAVSLGLAAGAASLLFVIWLNHKVCLL